MANKQTKVKVIDESSAEVDINRPHKNTPFDGPMATKLDDLTDAAISEITRSESEAAVPSYDEKVLAPIDKKTTLRDKLSNWFHRGSTER